MATFETRSQSPLSYDMKCLTQPKLTELLRAKRLQLVLSVSLLLTLTIIFLLPRRDLTEFDHIDWTLPKLNTSTDPNTVDWSRFAYIQYVTDSAYLCNSLMIFETLHRLGSKADRLMIYPSTMDPKSSSVDGQLLRKAEKEYEVKLLPVTVVHRPNGDSENATPTVLGCCY